MGGDGGGDVYCIAYICFKIIYHTRVCLVKKHKSSSLELTLRRKENVSSPTNTIHTLLIFGQMSYVNIMW